MQTDSTFNPRTNQLKLPNPTPRHDPQTTPMPYKPDSPSSHSTLLPITTSITAKPPTTPAAPYIQACILLKPFNSAQTSKP